MSAVSDYLSARRQAKNTETENLIRNVGSYSRNREALQALGQGTPEEQDAGFTDRAKGLVSSVFNVLGTPGRLVQAGLQEVSGETSEELEKVSGLDEFFKVLKGDINTSFSQVGGLKVKDDDGLGTRIAKFAGAFVADVATDPLSYVGAPSSISRTAASSQLIGAVRGERFLDDVISKSTKGADLIDELVSKAPVGKIAEMQKTLGLAAEAGTPLAVAEAVGKRKIAADQLADTLATALQTRGRTGLIKELENVTGSKANAISIFRSLPEEVKGGVVLTNILGKPVKNASGEYVRLTQGDIVPGLGKLAEVGNNLRLGMSVYPGNVFTSMLGGKAGPILAAVKKEALTKEASKAGRQASRLIDYVDVKRGLADRTTGRILVEGKAAGRALSAHQALSVFKGEDEAAAKAMFRQAYFSPTVPFDLTSATTAERTAFDEAAKIRDSINGVRAEAQAMGLEVPILGDPNEWSPLVVKPETYERWKRTGYIPEGVQQYIPGRPRDSHVGFEPDDEIARATGFRDPENPTIVYKHAIAANDALEKRALALGKSKEEAALERAFSEDPIQILQEYASRLANAAANKRFVDALTATGALVRDVPAVRKLLSEWESAQVISGLSGVSDDVKKFAEDRIEKAREELVRLTGAENIEEVRARVTASRNEAITARDIARERVATLTKELADAKAQVDEAAPRISRLKAQLRDYTETVTQSAEVLTARQKAAKNVKDRLARASKDLSNKQTTEEMIQELYASQLGGAEQAYYRELLDQVGERTDDVALRVQQEQSLLQTAAAELEQIKAAREAARNQGAQDIADQIDAYANAVTMRNAKMVELNEARAARDAANKMAKGAENKIGLEAIDAIDTLVEDYATAFAKYRAYAQQNKITKNTPPAVARRIREGLRRRKLVADRAKDILNQTLSTSETNFSSVAKDYAKEVLGLAKTLSTEQFNAIRILTDRNKLSQYIETVRTGARDEETVMQAMGDVVKTYFSIRDLVPKSTFNKLTDTQRALLINSNKAKLKERVLREARTTSELVSGLDQAGYSVIGKSEGKSKVYAASGVLEIMEQMYKTRENPGQWQKFLNDYIDPLLLAWKAGITIGRGPGYHVTNIIGGLYMNYLGNVPVSLFVKAGSVASMVSKTVKRLQTLNPTMSFLEVESLAQAEVVKELNKQVINGVGLGELLKDFVARGGFNSSEVGAVAQELAQRGIASSPEMFRAGAVIRPTYTTEAASRGEELYRKGLDWAFTNKLQSMGNHIAAESEFRLRFSAYLDGFTKYGDMSAAMDKVHLLHFDYQDLSEAEMWVRRLVPFYTWARRNVPAQMRAMFLQPGKIQRFLYANQDFQNSFAASGDESWLNQVLPEYLDTQNGFVSKFKFLDNNVGAYLRLPFEDVNRMFKLDAFPLEGKELAGMLGPYTIPLELATGVDIQTGRAIDSFGKDKIQTLGNVIPILGTYQRAAAGLGGIAKASGVNLPNIIWTEDQENKGVVTALNMSGIPALAGMSLATISPKGTNAELIRRVKSQTANINSAAAEKGVDPDWIREQVKKGIAPEVIASMIRSGMGKVDTRTEYSKMTPSKKRAALETFKNL
jgi:hypothetical protein